MRLFVTLLALASALSALAQTNTGGTAGYQAAPYMAGSAGTSTNAPTNVRQLSLQDCIQLALKHNLDLQIDRYGPQISLYNLRADYGAYDPSFNLSGEHSRNVVGSQLFGTNQLPPAITDDNSFNSSVGGVLPLGTTYSVGTGKSITDSYGTQGQYSSGAVDVSATQPLLKNLWIDQTRMTIRVAKNRLKYSEQTLKLQIMQTVTTLEQAYCDLIYDGENVLVQQKAVELAERLVAENKKKLEVGTMAPLDLQSAEAQAASSRAGVIAARNQLGTQERAVKQLITDRYPEWSTVILAPTGKLAAPRPVVNLQDSWSKGLSRRPEMVQAKLDVEQAGIQLKYAKNQLLPELDIFGTYGYNGSGKEFSDALYNIQQANRPYYTYGGKITFPLANITARNNYRAGKITLEQVLLTLKKLEESIMISIDNDVGTIRANFDQVQATRAAREYEESALDAEQKKLENGKSTTYTVLQVQRDLTSARGSEIQALDTYNKSLSQLSLDEGTTLERLQINLEVK
jgi:outer membrane protein TolC